MRGCKGKGETGKRGKSKREKKAKETKGKKRTVWICSLKKNFLVTLRRKNYALISKKSFWGLRPPDPLPGLYPCTILGTFVPQTLSLHAPQLEILYMPLL